MDGNSLALYSRNPDHTPNSQSENSWVLCALFKRPFGEVDSWVSVVTWLIPEVLNFGVSSRLELAVLASEQHLGID